MASADGLATQAGLTALARGGNAVDAAIATNAAIAVTAPHLCGLGGDLFALVHEPGAPPVALNASGRAGSGADPDALRGRGARRDAAAPRRPHGHGPRLRRRLGRAPRALRTPPAGRRAGAGDRAGRGRLPGLAAARRLAGHDRRAGPRPARRARPAGDAPGRARSAGRARRRALRAVAEGGRERLLRGRVRRGSAGRSAAGTSPPTTWPAARPTGSTPWRSTPGAIACGRCRPTPRGTWPWPERGSPRGSTCPADPDDPRWAHLLIEAAVAAGHDRPDVLHEDADGPSLVAPERARPAQRRHLHRIDIDSVERAPAGVGRHHLPVRGRRRPAWRVSLIQSNAAGFGSWLVEPATGINLHNRGLGFSLEPGHPAEYGPGRRPPHTLSPLLVTRPTAGWRPRSARWAATPSRRSCCSSWPACSSTASIRPRPSPAGAGCCTARRPASTRGPSAGGPGVLVEGHAPTAWDQGLRDRGHRVTRAAAFDAAFGHAHTIVVERRRQPRRARPTRGPASAPPPARDRRARTGCTRLRRACASTPTSSAPCRCPTPAIPTVAPTARRYGNDDVIACYENMLHWSQDRRRAGLRHDVAHRAPLPVRGLRGPAEPHHVRRRTLAAQTEELRFGQMFNVVPQWHPLRLAEDFALADVLTGGRMEFGVGRGTVPREAWALGTVVASGDNEMSAEHDRINREMFEEAMEVIKLAWYQERFAYRGKHFVFPPDDVPDRGTLRQRPHPHPQAPPARSTSTSRSRRRRRSSTCPGPATRPSTGCRTRTARSRSGTATPRSARRCGTPVGPGRGPLPGAQRPRRRGPARRRSRGAGPATTSSASSSSPYGRFSQLPLPRRLARCPSTSSPTLEDSMRPEDPDRRLDRRRGRRHRVLARPARPQAHLLLLRLPRPDAARRSTSRCTCGRGGLPPPRRAGGASAAPRPARPGLTAVRGTGQPRPPAGPAGRWPHDGRRHRRRRHLRRLRRPAHAPRTPCSTSTATCCSRRPSSRTPTSTRPSWPSASSTRTGDLARRHRGDGRQPRQPDRRGHRRAGRAGGAAAGGQRHRPPSAPTPTS